MSIKHSEFLVCMTFGKINKLALACLFISINHHNWQNIMKGKMLLLIDRDCITCHVLPLQVCPQISYHACLSPTWNYLVPAELLPARASQTSQTPVQWCILHSEGTTAINTTTCSRLMHNFTTILKPSQHAFHRCSIKQFVELFAEASWMRSQTFAEREVVRCPDEDS